MGHGRKAGKMEMVSVLKSKTEGVKFSIAGVNFAGTKQMGAL